ncbi:Bacteriocin cleavage/export ABC transporter [Oopsacas minuta]|uniref:Bacteriocin cleavage/export ABC transporter n=1 Tax=Oopsacas minuta TaxID=111878 RepID=A0AAV7JSU7_9METZ|nr:Bacteriocin cleavage/export ABC transporter [Oopsacas minuta]
MMAEELSIELDSNNGDLSLVQKMELDRKDFLFRYKLQNTLDLPTSGADKKKAVTTQVFVDYLKQGTSPEEYFKSIFLCELRRFYPQIASDNLFVDGLFLMIYNHVCVEVGEESCFDIEAIQSLLQQEESIDFLDHLTPPEGDKELALYNTVGFTFMNYVFTTSGTRGINNLLNQFYKSDSNTNFRFSGHNLSYHNQKWRIFLKNRECEDVLSYGTLKFILKLLTVDLFLDHYLIVILTVLVMLIDVSAFVYGGQVEATVIYLIATPIINCGNVTDGSAFFTFENQKPLLITCTILVGINVGLVLTDLTINALLSYLATAYGSKHRRIAFSSLHSMDSNHSHKFSSVNLIHLFGEDIDALQQVISTVFVFLGRFIILLFGSIVVCIIIHYFYLIFFSISYVVLYLLGSVLSYFLRKSQASKNALISGLTLRIQDIYEGFYENLHYNLKHHWIESMREKMNFITYGSVVWRAYGVTRVLAYLMNLVNLLLISISYLLPGILILYFNLDFELTLGALFIFFRIIRTPVELLNMNELMSKGAAAYSRLKTFEKLDSKRTDISELNETTNSNLNKELRPHIQLDNIYLSHFPEFGIWSLFDINLNIPFGQKVAIVGSSGSGKSSILNLILGFMEPTRGNVVLRNGSSDMEFGTKGLFGVIPQFHHTFNMSVSDNLKVVNVSVSEDKMIEACKSVSLHQWVMSLPLDYGSLLQKHGKNMSGGQKQRLAIAQAILANASVVVADECTSALDHATALHILDTLFRVTEDKTFIFATNRFERLETFDVIYVMAGGKMVESGSYPELIDQMGVFYSLYSHSQKSEA